MNTLNTIPEGYRINAQGHLVPESQIKPLDKLRDEMVIGIVEAARLQRQSLVEFKLGSMAKSMTLLTCQQRSTASNMAVLKVTSRWPALMAVISWFVP
jgi:hypothetical protein